MRTVFEHLDDPTPLAPSTREQRAATLRRGESLRRRRRGKVAAAAAAAVAVIGAFTLAPTLISDSAVPPVAASPSPAATSPSPSSTATATVGPGRGTVDMNGVPVTFTMPSGWDITGPWLAKSDNYGRPQGSKGPPFGFIFSESVDNIYTDGCEWRRVDPPPGPTVEDLASAFATVPGFVGVRETTVDGFSGKLVEFTVPDYQLEKCQDGRLGLFTEDGNTIGAPNIQAQIPNQQNQIWILDVNGTRMVIHAGYPPGITADDRSEIDEIIKSVDIG